MKRFHFIIEQTACLTVFGNVCPIVLVALRKGKIIISVIEETRENHPRYVMRFKRWYVPHCLSNHDFLLTVFFCPANVQNISHDESSNCAN
jgi:hypothetical protein